jgi:fatty-acyl-CoA synthase
MWSALRAAAKNAMNVDQWTFGRVLDEMAHRHGGRPAMVASDHSSGEARLRRWTYREMTSDVQALQWSLMDLGIRPGERVAVMLSSVPEWVLYLFAVTRLGAAFVPVNTRFKDREIHHILSHSGSCGLIATGRYLGQDHAAAIAKACGPRRAEGRFSRLPELRTLIGVGAPPHPDALDTRELLERGRERALESGPPPCALDATATAILFYTSGTTSFPKGVPLSHANLLPHSVRCGELLDLQPGESVLSLYPFFGISGGANKVLSTFGAGACLVFQDSYRPQEACDLLESQACTVIHAVDVQIREMVAILRKEGVRAPPERRGTIAFMASVDESLAREMGEVLGLRRFIHPYGMTETNPMILRN